MAKKKSIKLFQSQSPGLLYLFALIIGLLALASWLVRDPLSYAIGVVGGVLLGELLVLFRVQKRGVVMV